METQEAMKKIKGWKCFDIELKCRGHQFEIGKTYEVDGDIVLCQNGWHFHENGHQLFEYYSSSLRETRVCEVECWDFVTGDNKSACRKIKVLRELSLFEIGSLVGYGYGDGYGNGYGYGYGYGDGNGNGYGYGNGYGNGDGDGYGDGYGYGYGYGDGDGYGDGYGYGNGDGYGYGYGYGNKISFIIGFLEKGLAA
jgi:hypothetical protein